MLLIKPIDREPFLVLDAGVRIMIAESLLAEAGDGMGVMDSQASMRPWELAPELGFSVRRLR